jgi:hypothetical protein
MVIRFNQIYISPEQINQTEFVRERKIKDGSKTSRRQGKEVLAEDSKVIMVDNFKCDRAHL